ncbi:CDGSH iron-sulfur domain-containing protein [Paenibacillus roseipurpureus]|uniref:CDGSH iron-sulfur domain-containing protein n=1 Tax=Paenibacillus roseopurpureus TaxID=2918901 RepID=A0AA96LPI5_9BACL|nr:CDGSH iron-sulfur domain-containing protein [Paenibacillus sp. MBLB1832]WNR44926.1 CDGSH iron-sulfur domain-containing protein [Paenibacillus sp. MBLB1832]
MAVAQIQVRDDGPLLATGVTLVDGEGKPMETKESIYLCRCGLSDNKPFCNGAHKGKFESKVRA